jgi:hypothetical protein
MRNVRMPVLVILSFVFFAGIWPAYAQPVSSGQLIGKANEYDGQVVTYAGEAIGDIMRRGDHVWVNVHDSNNAIGVWLPESAVAQGLRGGSYASKGDWIEVSGIFRRACPEHGGDLDIHAEAIRIVTPGRPLRERLSTDKRNMAITLMVCLCLALILRRLKTV